MVNMVDDIESNELFRVAEGMASGDLRKIYSDYVIDVVCKHFNGCSRKNVVVNQTNHRDYVFARYAVYDILYRKMGKLTGGSVSFTSIYIQHIFKKKTHSNVLHGLKAHDNLMSSNDKLYCPQYNAAWGEIDSQFHSIFMSDSLERRLSFVEEMIGKLMGIRDEIVIKLKNKDNDGKSIKRRGDSEFHLHVCK